MPHPPPAPLVGGHRVPAHSLWYKVALMPTYGTLYIGRRSAESVLHAVRYARDTGRPLNTLITISFTALDIPDQRAGSFFNEHRERVGRWWRHQRRKGRDIGPPISVHSHANPAGSRHVHWMVHVPDSIRTEFAAVVRNRLAKLAHRTELDDALDIRRIETPGGVAKYILRGIHPDYATYLHIEPAQEGLVSCRRTGTTRAVGRAARRGAGWLRRGRR